MRVAGGATDRAFDYTTGDGARCRAAPLWGFRSGRATGIVLGPGEGEVAPESLKAVSEVPALARWPRPLSIS